MSRAALNMQKTGRAGYRAVLMCLLITVVPCVAMAQSLNFSNHREVGVPEYAVLRIGPFYSSVEFSQSAGYRYTKGSGNGIDFLFENQRGVFLKDGSDFPLISTLDLRNYLLISRTADLDVSLRGSYAHYPFKTQKDELIFDLAEEGMAGNLSSEFSLTPYVKGTVHDTANYRTDYIDKRGLADRYGGQAYEHFQNTVGLNLDWLIVKDQNLELVLSRADMLPSDDAFKDQQCVSYSENLIYQYVINPMVMAGVSAAFGQNSYAEVTNRPDTYFQTYSAFSTVRLTDRTIGSAGIGYSKVAFPSFDSEYAGNVVDNGGVIGSFSLKTELSRDLMHQLEFSRAMTAGYNSPYEFNDRFGYHLNWKGDGLVSGGFFSLYNRGEPGDPRISEYADWMSGINVALPVTSIVTLTFDTAYSMRKNKVPDNIMAKDVLERDVELRYDYNTWSSRLGTTFAITKSVGFSSYLQHMQRFSDFSPLAYSRDVFLAMFTYTHKF